MDYIAFFPEGNWVLSNSVEHLAEMPRVERIATISTYHGSQHKFDFVDESGRSIFIKVGGFQLLDIGRTNWDIYSRRHACTLTICELRLNRTFEHTLKVQDSPRDVYETLLPFLGTLDSFGSYDAYLTSEENVKLKGKVNELEELLNQCRTASREQ